MSFVAKILPDLWPSFIGHLLPACVYHLLPSCVCHLLPSCAYHLLPPCFCPPPPFFLSACLQFVAILCLLFVAFLCLLFVASLFAICCQPVFAICCQVFQKPWSVAMTSDKRVLVTDAGSSCGEGFVAVCDLNGKFLRYLAKVGMALEDAFLNCLFHSRAYPSIPCVWVCECVL